MCVFNMIMLLTSPIEYPGDISSSSADFDAITTDWSSQQIEASVLDPYSVPKSNNVNITNNDKGLDPGISIMDILIQSVCIALGVVICIVLPILIIKCSKLKKSNQGKLKITNRVMVANMPANNPKISHSMSVGDGPESPASAQIDINETVLPYGPYSFEISSNSDKHHDNYKETAKTGGVSLDMNINNHPSSNHSRSRNSRFEGQQRKSAIKEMGNVSIFVYDEFVVESGLKDEERRTDNGGKQQENIRDE